jgi:hypothetical protein
MKSVVLYANCQGHGIRQILACHPEMSKDYDLHNATVLGNYTYMNTETDLPIDVLKNADLLIYQPISSDRGKYSSQHLKKMLKPGCKTESFVYLYNYSFWETLVFADGDYDIGTFGMKYASLNHEPITSLRDAGLSWDEIQNRIINNTLDWKFKERYEKTQSVLREKEAQCSVKVADFIDFYHKDKLLFYSQNHPTMFLLVYVAKQILTNLGYNPHTLPPIDTLPHPDYNSGRGKIPHFQFGLAAWEYYKFTFIPRPDQNALNAILENAKRIYDGQYVNQ